MRKPSSYKISHVCNCYSGGRLGWCHVDTRGAGKFIRLLVFPLGPASGNEQKENRTVTIRQRLREERANGTVYEGQPIYRQARRGEFSSRTRSNVTKVAETKRKEGNGGREGGGIKRKPWRGGGGGRTRRVSCKELEIKLRGKLDRIIVVSTLVCRIAWLHEGNARTISLLCKYYSHPWRLVKMVRSNKWYNKWKDDSSILWIS